MPDNSWYGAKCQSRRRFFAKREINKYKKGKTVSVYYSPEDTSYAVLENGVSLISYIILIFGALIILSGISLLISSLFKIAIFAAMIGVFTGSLFKRNKKTIPHASSPPRDPFKRSSRSKHTPPSFESDINLDDEMDQMNALSSSSLSPRDEPWKHKWIIRGNDKEYGPYPFEKITLYCKQGKIKEKHKCFSPSNNQMILVGDIIHKRR